MNMSPKHKKRKGIFGVPSKSWSDESDDSDDSDYDPKLDNDPTEKQDGGRSKLKKRTPKGRGPHTQAATTAAPVSRAAGQGAGLGSLPTELLVKIFRYAVASEGAIPFVPWASRVCRKWRDILRGQPGLWWHVNLPVGWSRNADAVVRRLVESRGHVLERLSLNAIASVTDNTVLHVAHGCPNLRGLSLRRCSLVTHKHLEALKECPLLREVDMSYTHVTSYSANTVMKRFVTTHPELEVVKIAGCRALNDGFVASLAECTPRLRILDLSATGVCNFDIGKLQAGCPLLETLTLRACKLVLSRPGAGGVGFARLRALDVACVQERLQFQFIEDNTHMADEALAALLRGATALDRLDVCGMRALSAGLYDRVGVVEVRVFRASRSGCCARDGAARLAAKWGSSLRELDLSWNPAVDDTQLHVVAQRCTSLTSLNLAGTEVTTTGVTGLMANCPSLVELDLSSCRGVTRGYKKAYEGDELTKLRAHGFLAQTE